MQEPPARSPLRLIDRILVPFYLPEYGRLLWRSHVLMLRLQWLSLMATLIQPVATPGLLEMLLRRFDSLRVDVAEFKRAVLAPKSHLVLQPQPPLRSALPARMPPADATTYENPWI